MGRKRLYLSVLVVVLGFFTQVKAQENEITNKDVVIDAGHGGIDSGAISKRGLMEKDVVLDIARWIRYWNREVFNNRYDIYLSRDKDSLISLSDRGKLVKAIKPDIFISLHCNHSQNNQAKGVEAYIFNAQDFETDFQKEAIHLGEALLFDLQTTLGFVSRGVKQANFQVLRDTRKVCPGVLLEMGFLSRAEECNYLSSTDKLKALSLRIYLSFSHFLNHTKTQ